MAESQSTKAAASKTVYTPVKMSDGRVVQFAGKRKMVKEVDPESLSVRFDFANGETRTFTIGNGLLNQFAVHGAAQKIGDETAGEEDVDDMTLAVDAIIERLSKGEWGITRAAGDGFSGASIVVKALCEVTGKTVADVKAFIDGKLAAAEASGQKLTRQELYRAFRAPGTKTAAVIARLEAEKASKGSVSGEDLLAEMGV